MTVARGTFRVARAVVKYGYTTAADVKDAVIRRDEITQEITLTATAIMMNPYLLAQRPLELVIPTGARWPLTGVTWTTAQLPNYPTLTARVILEG